MLENLASSVPQLTGNINYTYDNAVNVIPSVLFFFLGLLAILLFFCFLGKLSRGRKSEYYRKVMSDMYVVGMVKKFAAEDGIDLLVELRDYMNIVKKEEMKHKGLDWAIETHLTDKVAEKSVDKLDKSNKK